jgi:hypothetical protein
MEFQFCQRFSTVTPAYLQFSTVTPAYLQFEFNSARFIQHTILGQSNRCSDYATCWKIRSSNPDKG